MLDRISMPSLFLATTTVQIVAAFLVLASLKMYEREPAVRWWAASYTLYAASAFTYALSGGKISLLVIAQGNTFAISAAACLYSGIAIFMDRKISVRLVIGVLISALVSISFFAVPVDSLASRNLIYTIANNLFYIMAIHCLLCGKNQNRGFLHYIISFSLALFVVTMSARAVDLFLMGPNGGVLQNSLIQIAWMAGIQLTTFITAFGFLLLISSKMATKLKHLGHCDPLTGALNRTQFEDNTRGFLDEYMGANLALLIIDLDSLKSINDQYGHDAGDKTLAKIAEAISYGCPKSSIFGRAGGDEFWLITDAAGSSVETLAHSLCSSIENTEIRTEKASFKISASIGICEFEASQYLVDAAGLYSSADAALYRAKSDGRNCFRIATHPREAEFAPSPA
ncbi:MAG: diguanylate cyclase (GGDEF)-like protein [Bacteroidia bacterium]|jgi:diguanylate cyclase (GGDEF)-like protein